jgi:hypothetical protein
MANCSAVETDIRDEVQDHEKNLGAISVQIDDPLLIPMDNRLENQRASFKVIIPER